MSNLATNPVTHTAYCRGCRLKHPIRAQSPAHLRGAWEDWREKHRRPTCKTGLRRAFGPAWLDRFAGNADVKEAMQTETALTVTNLHSLASSATAGWTSGSIDNSSNLYLDSLVMVHIAAVNTAPSSDKKIYVFAYGSTDGAIWTSTGTSGGTVGTEGALTFPSISTLPILMPLIGVIPYPVQNKALDGGPFSVARAFGGTLPVSWGVAVLNFSGMTLAASANTVKYRGQFNTVI